MRIAMIGLGKMGANMARRLCRGGIEVVGYNRSSDIVSQLEKEEGLLPAASLEKAIVQLPAPRIVWLMLPSGAPTESTIELLAGLLCSGDILIDGGNANYHDSQRRAARLAKNDIGFVDAGTSGGVWGLDNGYCMMVGGDEAHVKPIEPLLKILAPADNKGWAHVGPPGAGHFTKMVHNGIEYGMMQAMAEGFSLLQGKQELQIDLAEVAEIWRHGSVVRSWLLDLTAEFLRDDQKLENISAYVADSGEGRWTAEESIAQGTPTPVMTLALLMRFASQNQESYGNKMLAMMRNAFGGHGYKNKE
ncbi:MAG TPA: decarboxylating 6-phosphogluconate dehydrogenase [Gammaproteobacteria bacterium]|nr:decarboxylating 6-phosphogluconate dehydrogenase [Gammaproteobacteria bacterium]